MRICSLYKISYDTFRQRGLQGLARAVLRKITNELFCIIPSFIQQEVLNVSYRLRYTLFPQYYIPKNPYKVTFVDPDKITYHVNHNQAPLLFGRVAGGDWDLKRKRFDNTFVYQSLKARFKHGEPWENTELFDYLLDKPEWVFWNREYESKKARDQYLQQIDDLYEKISEEGYRTQEELLKREREDTLILNNDGVHPYFNEIGVNIGRNGELLWRHRGLHRLAIAKIIGIDQVAVQIRTCHKQWYNSLENSQEISLII